MQTAPVHPSHSSARLVATVCIVSLAAFLALGCFLFAFLWLQSRATVRDLNARITKLQTKLSDADMEAERLRSEATAFKVKPVQPQKTTAPATQTAAAVTAEQPLGGRRSPPQPSQAQTAFEAKPTADPVATRSDENASQSNENGSPKKDSDAVVSSVSESPDPPDSRNKDSDGSDAAGPRLSKSVQQDLDDAIAKAERSRADTEDTGKAKGKKQDKSKDKTNPTLRLIENFVDAKPTVTLGPEGACKLLNASLKSVAGKWELTIAKKLAAKILYDKAANALVMEILPSGAPLHYLRFLTLTSETKSKVTLSVPLGSPSRATFALKETSKNHYTFFDDDTNALVSTLLEDFKEAGVYESLTFADESGIKAFTTMSEDRPEYMQTGKPSFTAGQLALIRGQGDPAKLAGVVLKRVAGQPTAYVWEDYNYVIDPSCVVELGKPLGITTWDWCVLPANPSTPGIGVIPDLHRVIEQKLEPERDPDRRLALHSELVTHYLPVQNYINNGYLLAETLVTNLTKPRPVRFEFRVPGSDDGLVVVDSLTATDAER